MSRSITITNTPVKCYFCDFNPNKALYFEFQKTLDEADEKNGNKHDKDLLWEGHFSAVGKDFYVCKKHIDKVTCDECQRLMTRHQIDNAIHSQKGDHYNLFREGPRHMDFGNELKPACTDCWIKYDSDLREELGIYQCHKCKETITEEQYNDYQQNRDHLKDSDDEEDSSVGSESALCIECVGWTCSNCSETMTFDEIYYYRQEPCGLDWQIYYNQDTEGNPHCDDCYEKLKLERSWKVQAGYYKKYPERKNEYADDSSEEEESEIEYPPLPPSPSEEPKPEVPSTVRMWNRALTLEDLNNHADAIPKARIQDENVRYGLAYCSAETKDKSIQKLRTYLEKNPNSTYLATKPKEEVEAMSYSQLSHYILHVLNIKGEVSKAHNKEDLFTILQRYTPYKEKLVVDFNCSIQINGDRPMSFTLPPEKSKQDLIAHIYNFFQT